MNSCLASLPNALINHLGKYSRLNEFLEIPQTASHFRDLRKNNKGDPYHVAIDAHGLTVTLQCMNPDAQPEDQTWGLHGITLNANVWDGGWPTGLNPQTATATDVVALFAPKPEEVVNMHPMLCFAIEGAAGQTWSVMAMFDASSKKLRSFSLIRVGEWRELQNSAPDA